MDFLLPAAMTSEDPLGWGQMVSSLVSQQIFFGLDRGGLCELFRVTKQGSDEMKAVFKED